MTLQLIVEIIHHSFLYYSDSNTTPTKLIKCCRDTDTPSNILISVRYFIVSVLKGQGNDEAQTHFSPCFPPGRCMLMLLHHAHTHTLFLMTSRYSLSIYNTCLAQVAFILLIHSLMHVNTHWANGVCMKMHLALYERRCCTAYDFSGTHWLPPIRIRRI